MPEKKGQTILELIFAVSIIVIILTAIIGAVLISSKNVDFAKNQTLATRFAQEGMEIARKVRDSGWESSIFGTLESEPDISSCSVIRYVNPASGGTLNPNPAFLKISGTIFEREVIISQVWRSDCSSSGDSSCGSGSNCLDSRKVIITVKWTDSGGSHKSELTSYFTKWQ